MVGGCYGGGDETAVKVNGSCRRLGGVLRPETKELLIMNEQPLTLTGNRYIQKTAGRVLSFLPISHNGGPGEHC